MLRERARILECGKHYVILTLYRYKFHIGFRLIRVLSTHQYGTNAYSASVESSALDALGGPLNDIVECFPTLTVTPPFFTSAEIPLIDVSGASFDSPFAIAPERGVYRPRAQAQSLRDCGRLKTTELTTEVLAPLTWRLSDSRPMGIRAAPGFLGQLD